jgi:hypothetical protein
MVAMMAKRGRKREAKVEAVTPGRLKSFVDRIVAQEEQLAALDAEFRMLGRIDRASHWACLGADIRDLRRGD